MIRMGSFSFANRSRTALRTMLSVTSSMRLISMQWSMILCVRVQRLECSCKTLGGRDDVVANLDHHRRDRLDVVDHHSVRRFLDRIDNIIQMRGKRMDVFGIERRDERLIQPAENVMDDFVGFALETCRSVRRLSPGARCLLRRPAAAGLAASLI